MKDWIESIFLLGATALFIWGCSGAFSMFIGSACLILLAYLMDEESGAS